MPAQIDRQFGRPQTIALARAVSGAWTKDDLVNAGKAVEISGFLQHHFTETMTPGAIAWLPLASAVSHPAETGSAQGFIGEIFFG